MSNAVQQGDINLNPEKNSTLKVGTQYLSLIHILNGVNISNPQTGHNASDFPVALADIRCV